MKILIFFTLISMSIARAEDLTPEKVEELHKIVSPRIEGDVLRIEGLIDSHIYDFLSYEAAQLKKVSVIELNSLGGSHEWGLEIAKKIQSLHVTTRLKPGNYCASACVFLFAAGQNREAAQGTWFGIHGARLGVGYKTNFVGLCFIDLEGGASQFVPKKKGCQEFLNHWYDISMKATLDAFTLMESNGVLAKLRETYFAMPDDPDWADAMNVVRKPDWVLQSTEALQYNLVTEVF